MAPVNRLDPLTKEFNLLPLSRPQQTQQLTLPAAINPLTAIRPPQGASQHLATRPKEWTNSNSHHRLERETLMSTHSRPNTQPTDRNPTFVSILRGHFICICTGVFVHVGLALAAEQQFTTAPVYQ